MYQEASSVRVRGPLAGAKSDLIVWMTCQRFQPSTTSKHVQHLALLSRWLDDDGLGLSVVDESCISDRLRRGEGPGWVRALTVLSFRRVLEFLRSAGLIAVPPTPRVVSPLEVMLDEYRRWLLVERGLMTATANGYVRFAGKFMVEVCAGEVSRVALLNPEMIARFVIVKAETNRASSVNRTVSLVRSFLRWLYVGELIATPLAQATPWLARGRMSTLPQTVQPGTAQRMIKSCDTATLAGVRDIAVMTLLSRLGLRAGEVLAMQIGDIDWRRGELTVRSKGGGRDVLPLPVDVGRMLARYLHHRGRDEASRHVFLCVVAPYQPMTVNCLNATLRRASERAGLPNTFAHRLRHSVARDLLREGASLPEIGQVLRHRALATTAVYAKVDFAALAALTQPWPVTS
jgi:integrase/recombinase XerD